MIDNHKLVTLITEEEIKAAVIKAANDYAKIYENQQLTIVAELSNTFVFVADLIRELPIDVTIQFITRKNGQDDTTKIDLGLTETLEDKNVLIVCDIFYKGSALKKTYDLVMAEKPKDVKLLALIDKKTKDKNEELNVESLFKLEDVFVVGYGLTHNESYRGLKGIYNLQVEEN